MKQLANRREVLGLIGGAGASIGVQGCASDTRQGLGIRENGDLKALMLGEGDGAFEMSPERERTLLDNQWEPLRVSSTDWNWWDLETDVQSPVKWATPQNGMDYQPLGDFIGLPVGPNTFVHAESLRWLADRNAFSLGTEQFVIVGIRGASLVDASEDSGWQSNIRIALDEPDHKSMRCLIGVWDRENNKVRLFKASTVPEVSYMWLQATLASSANMLPTGLYRYSVGTHNASSSRVPQVGALRLQGYNFHGRSHTDKNIFVLRTLNDLSYSIGDKTELWDICVPFDNIHAGIFGEATQYLVGAKNQQFSSAGCQVLPGGYELFRNSEGKRAYTTEPIGIWRDFREAIGLKASPELTEQGGTTDDGKNFYYMLLTGWDISYAARRNSAVVDSYFPIRPGSSGNLVAAVQRIIGMEETGKLDARTSERIVSYKKVIAEIPETPLTLKGQLL